MSLADDAQQHDALEENEALRKALRDTNRKLATAKAKTVELVDAVFRGAESAALAVGRTAIPAPARDRRKPRGETALLHLTDWQGGKATPSYGLDVMDARVDRFMHQALKITEIQRAHHPVRDAVLLFGGDLLEGVSIFPGQVWQVDSTLFEQVFRVASKVEDVVRFALTHYERVHVVFEPGNHGRIGGKHDGIPHGDNFDRMIGEIVRLRLEAEKRLTWESRDSWSQQVVVGNYRAMLIHGDEVRGFGGNTPAYALVRKGNAWASGAAKFEFRDIYVGHYHQPMQLTLANGGQLYMTGSTESDNAYAAEFVAATSVPSQRLHFIDPEKGRVTAQYVVWLD